jgi:hypothetical protein
MWVPPGTRRAGQAAAPSARLDIVRSLHNTTFTARLMDEEPKAAW